MSGSRLRTLSAALGLTLLACVVATLLASPASAAVDCAAPTTHQITGTQTAPLTLTGPGNWCIHDATLYGQLTIGGGANVRIVSTTLYGRLSPDQGGSLQLCGSRVQSSVTFSRTTGFLVLGDPSNGCPGNTFLGAVVVTGSTGGVEIAGNSFGGALTLTANAGDGADHGGSPDDRGTQVEGNSFGGAVECTGNTPAPTDVGVPNTGPGALLGQCATSGGAGSVHANNDSYTTLENAPLNVAAPGVLANDTNPQHAALRATLVTAPAHGTLTLNADGSFAYTPAAGYHGPDKFTYTADDGLVASNVATVSIRVDAPPVAAPDSYTVLTGGTLSVAAPGVLGNDSDPDGDVLHAVLVGGPAHGTLTLNASGGFVYTPAAGFHGADSFTYKANDGFADSNVATVSITVDAPPVAVADFYAVAQNGSLTVAAPGVLGNDTDADGDALHAVLVAGPAHGSLTFNADGSFSYTPAAGFHGTDSFTYKANDGFADSNVATVSIRVDAPPVAVGDSYATVEGTVLTVAAPGVLANDSDPDGDALSAALSAGPAHGSVTLNADGSFVYTPAPGFHGSDSFTYTASDGFLASNVATVSIRVDAPPVAVDDAYSVTENTTLTVAAPGVLGNDTDADGDALHAVLVAGPAHGTLTLNADGSFSYVPATGFTGSDSFTYKANDGFADSNVATVSIAVNGRPTVVNQSYVTVENTTLTRTAATGVLAGASDPGGHPLSAILVAGPAHGTLTLNSDGSFTYVPTAGFFGSDSFTFKANDGTLDSSVGTASIRVDAPPVAVNDSYTVLTGGTLNVPAPGVLANDTDPDGDALHAVLVAAPAHGTLTLNADGSFNYVPAGGYHGPDSFTYRANDGIVESNTATVSIRVDAPPVAVADSYVTLVGQTLNVPAPGVLANDTDADGDALHAVLVAGPAHGTLTLNADGSFSYSPTAGFNGMDSFTYKANDGFADSNVATVSIRVDAPPVAVDDAYSVAQGALLSVGPPGVLGNDTDADGDTLHAVLVSGPAHGTLTLNADGSFTYTPAAAFFGSDSFTYKANDGVADSNVATVSITVTHVNQPPVNTVPAATQSVTENSSLVFKPANANTISVADPDAFTTDVEQVSLSVGHGTLTIAAGSGIAVTAGANGSAALTIQGTLTQLNAALNGLTYAPAAAYAGPDTLTLVTNDLGHNGSGGPLSATSTVAITVIAAPPVVVPQSFSGAVGNTKFEVAAAAGTGPEVFRAGNVLTGDSDPNGGTLSVTAGTIAAAHGSVTMAADGTFTYLPAAGFAGPTDSFSYTVNTSESTSATATATINFTGLRVWYVNGNAVTNGDGRSSSPFNVLTPFGAGRPDSTGDTIFLYKRTAGAYAGGITLLGSETLLGQSVGLSSGADVLVAASGANSAVTNASGAGVTLASADTIQGIDVTNASGAGITGNAITTATIDTSSSAGSIGGSGGAGFSLSGGSGNVALGASISGSTGAAVSVSSRTGGTVALSGAIGGNAIALQSNTGATINFTGAITISSGAGAGFVATGGGTVTATASGSTLTSTSGRALDVASTTIGSSGLKFQSISSSGAPNGIVLDTTGASGSLTVTGNGGTCTAANTAGCSGGQIQNSVGGDDSGTLPVGTGIALNSTLSPSFTRIWVHDASNYAIHGNAVNGFTLAASVINGTNGTNAATPFNDSSVRFANLTGSATVSNTAVSGGFSDNFNVTNTSGSLNRITFDTDTIGDNSAAGGNDAIGLSSAASAGQLEATIQNSTFTGAAGDLVDFNHGGSGAGDLVIANSHFSNNHPGIATGGGGLSLGSSGTAGPTTISVTASTFRDAVGPGILVVKSTGSSTLSGTFSGNTIGVSGVASSGSAAGDALKLQTAGGGTATWSVTSNQIFQFGNFGVDVLAGGGATAQAGAVNATVTGNTIAQPAPTSGFSTDGIQFNIGTVVGDTYAACAVVGGSGGLVNTVNGTGTNGAMDIRLRQRQSTTFRLPGYAGAPTDATAVQSFVAANNAVSPTVLASISSGGFTGGTPATCP